MFERFSGGRYSQELAIVAGTAAVVVLAACGSGSSNGAPASSATSHATTTVRARVSDQTVVNAVVLRPSDLPASWLTGPVEPNDTTGDAETTACLGIPNSDSSETAYAGSHAFTLGAVRVFSKATAFSSRSVVVSDLSVTDSPKLTTCVARDLQANAGATNVHIAKVAMPTSAAALNGFHLIGTATVQTASGPRLIGFEEVALEKGRVEVSANITSLGSNIPAGVMERLTAAIAPRLRSTAT
jgi:hypothetical protein